MIFASPMCCACKHLVPEDGNWHCTAFPNGLPNQIVEDGFDHRKPFKGDNGIRFEQDPSKPNFVFP